MYSQTIGTRSKKCTIQCQEQWDYLKHNIKLNQLLNWPLSMPWPTFNFQYILNLFSTWFLLRPVHQLDFWITYRMLSVGLWRAFFTVLEICKKKIPLERLSFWILAWNLPCRFLVWYFIANRTCANDWGTFKLHIQSVFQKTHYSLYIDCLQAVVVI